MPKAKELQELGEWKVGQEVLIRGSGLSIRPITRITDGRGGTIYAGDNSFDKNGRQRGGDGWLYLRYITPVTEEDRIEITGKNARFRISHVEWHNLEPSKAIEIEKLLNENGIKTK